MKKFSIRTTSSIWIGQNEEKTQQSTSAWTGTKLSSVVLLYFISAFNNYHPEKIPLALSSPPLSASGLFLSPSSYDWKALGRVTPVKNQGSCGSCWAFGSTAQYESLLSIATNGIQYDLSEQYSVECDNISSGCNGGYPYYTNLLINETGIPL